MPDTLEFFEHGHRYEVNGIEVPSVSEVTRFIADAVYPDRGNNSFLEHAAERGTAVHKATEELDNSGKVELVDGEIIPYVKAYAKFIKDHDPTWFGVEWAVHHGYDYAGTIDRYGILDGQYCIMDIKTTTTIGKGQKALYEAAQNLYRKAVEESDEPSVIEKLFILQLKKNETYKLIELPISDTLADACLALHNSLKKKKRKRKEVTE